MFSPHSPRISRSELDGMVASFIANGGQPRRFETGFTSDWIYLRDVLGSFGYEVGMKASWYFIRKIGAKGRPQRMSRVRFIAEVDRVLVANGREPFMKRTAA